MEDYYEGYVDAETRVCKKTEGSIGILASISMARAHILPAAAYSCSDRVVLITTPLEKILHNYLVCFRFVVLASVTLCSLLLRTLMHTSHTLYLYSICEIESVGVFELEYVMNSGPNI